MRAVTLTDLDEHEAVSDTSQDGETEVYTQREMDLIRREGKTDSSRVTRKF